MTRKIVATLIYYLFMVLALPLAPIFFLAMIGKQAFWDIPKALAMRGIGELNAILSPGPRGPRGA